MCPRMGSSSSKTEMKGAPVLQGMPRRALLLITLGTVVLLCLITGWGSVGAAQDLASHPAAAQSKYLVPWQDGAWLLSGTNVAWQNGGFGADFGTVEEWNQHTYDHDDTGQMFAALAASGSNTVRWWVFADGRGCPEFDSDTGGNVVGLDGEFLPSMEDAVRLAAEHNIYLIFNLWSFDMLYEDSTPDDRGEHGGGHRDLIVDEIKLQSFIDNALLPMLYHPLAGTGYTIGTHPNVLGWDIINEPEWGISESASVNPHITQPVSLEQMQRFVAGVSAAIHQHSNQLVTLGSASLKWNSDGALGATGNWWSDAELTPHAPEGYLDFYQVHYYGWMNGNETSWSYSPLFNTHAAAGLDKPTVVGEFPASGVDTGYIVTEILDGIYANGYAGAWNWTYEGVDGMGSWADSESAYTTFNAAHQEDVDIEPAGSCRLTALADIDSGTISPTGNYRWRDVADQLYSEAYRTTYDYTQATVEVIYRRVGSMLHGTLQAQNLKPNFGYQLKLAGKPGTAANERIGLAGRWWEEEWDGAAWSNGRNLNNKDNGTSPNPNDAVYFARRDIFDATSPTERHYKYTGYLVFDYFVTDGNGDANLTFQTDSSYHVLWKTSQRAWTVDDGPLETTIFDADLSTAYDDTGGDDFSSQTVSIFGEWERLPVGGVFLQRGHFEAELILTEESFHGSGGSFAGGWAGAMAAELPFSTVPGRDTALVTIEPGWNLVSFAVEPADPSLEGVLCTVGGCYCRVLGQDGIYDCSLESTYHTLEELHAGQGYYLRSNRDRAADLLVEGTSLPANAQIPLQLGWNWIGYLPDWVLPIEVALQNIEGKVDLVHSLDRTYDPDEPLFSTLTYMEPGQGYLIHATESVDLVYPASQGQAAATATGEGTGACDAQQPTPHFALVYGRLAGGEGGPAKVGTVVKALTPRGEVAGCLEVQYPGEYGYMRIYGQDLGDSQIPGFRDGEPVAFQVDGLLATPSLDLTWSNDLMPRMVDLKASSASVPAYLPLVRKE